MKGSFWAFLEQVVGQALNFALGIVLARLLTPDDFGTVALVTIFLTVSMALVSAGFGQALVQKQDADDLDFNSVFWIGFVVSCLLYAVLFFAAPLVARYYRVAELTPILRILSLNLVVYSLGSVQNAELFRTMQFNKTFWVTFASVVVSSCVGIGMACFGYGVWALVWSSLLSNVAAVLLRGFFVSWRPRFRFSWARVKPLFRFGWKMMVSSLVCSFVSNLYGIIIGRTYTRADLAYLNKGRNIPELLKNSINNSIVEAAFPALSKLQDDRDRMRHASMRLLSVSSFAIVPLMLVLGAMSGKMIVFLYGPQWAPCVPFARIEFLTAAVTPLMAVNEQAITAIGRSDVTLKLVVLKLAISFAILMIFLPMGVFEWVLAVAAIGSPLALFLDLWESKRLLGYGWSEQFRRMRPIFFASLAMALPVVFLDVIWTGTSTLSLFACLSCQGLSALVVFAAWLLLFRPAVAAEVFDMVEPKVGSRFPALAAVMSNIIKRD